MRMTRNASSGGKVRAILLVSTFTVVLLGFFVSYRGTAGYQYIVGGEVSELLAPYSLSDGAGSGSPPTISQNINEHLNDEEKEKYENQIQQQTKQISALQEDLKARELDKNQKIQQQTTQINALQEDLKARELEIELLKKERDRTTATTSTASAATSAVASSAASIPTRPATSTTSTATNVSIPLNDEIEFPWLVDKVLFLDMVWLPKQSKVVFLACTPEMFVKPKMLKLRTYGGGGDREPLREFEGSGGVKPEDLRNPLHILRHKNQKNNITNDESLTFTSRSSSSGGNDGQVIEFVECQDYSTLEVADANIRGVLYIVHCTYNNNTSSTTGITTTTAAAETGNGNGTLRGLDISYKGRQVSWFEFPNRLNAAPSMRFRRNEMSPATTRKDNFSVSVLIKGAFQYSSYVVDTIRYYRRQGISHVYLGLFPMDGDIRAKYEEDFRNETGFVSFGGMIETADTFQHLAINGWKMSYMQSALYHAKSFDDMLIVVDADEVLASLKPLEQSIVDILRGLQNWKRVCSFQFRGISASSSKGTNGDAVTLMDHSPDRCLQGGKIAYVKSVAVLANTNFVGLHFAEMCRPGTMRDDNTTGVDAAILHFINLWFGRFRKYPECNVTNEFRTFMHSDVSFS